MSLEVHLLDFAGDIYGQHLRVDFLHKLRDEVKYAGLEPLVAQIKLDVENTRAYYRERHHSERISDPRP
jgi:riboflavin kinase / FMN adenylyltransferase